MRLVVEPKIENNQIKDIQSQYNPGKEIRDRLSDIQQEFNVAEEIRNKTYREFDNKSLITRQDLDQKAFNSYVPELPDDPTQNWKANTVRPLTRNKVISIAAHISSAVIYPNIQAQNENQDEDKEAAMIMKDLMEYSWEQSKYVRTFVFGVIAALVNPALIIYEGFTEFKRKIKELAEDGTYKDKEIVDDVFSGYQNIIVPCEQLYIGNIYEHDIQKQPFLIWRRIIDFSEARIKYGEDKDFKKYVSPGTRVFLNSADNSFYEQQDEEMGTKVEEIIYYNRLADLELVLINGVLMGGDPNRPIQRKDKRYPFCKTGYELIDEGKFFYFKSLVHKLKGDQQVIDTLYNMVIDGTFLQLFPPLANYGGEEQNSSVIIPGMITNQQQGSKLEAFLPQNNLTAGLNTLQKVESSASESSQDPRGSGQATSGSNTAFEVARLEQNAATVLGLTGKMFVFLVEDFGELRKETILQYATVADLVETVGENLGLKYKSFLIPDRSVNGTKMSRRIDFQLDSPRNEDELLDQSFKIKEEEDKKGISIAKVNPELFRNSKFKVKVSPETLQSNSEAVKKALNLEAFDRLIGLGQAVNQEAIIRDFLLESYKPGESQKYLNQNPVPMMPTQPAGKEVVSSMARAGQLPLTKQVV